MQSDPEEEYEEILLKARALMNAISVCVTAGAGTEESRPGDACDTRSRPAAGSRQRPRRRGGAPASFGT